MSFITVRFGDNEEELFNPNCVTVNLLDNLRRRCGCQKGNLFFTDHIVILDLSDEDGDIKNLHEYPTQYAHRFLKGREVFVLIKVEKGQGDQPTTYTALLNDLERSNPKLLGEFLAHKTDDRLMETLREFPTYYSPDKLGRRGELFRALHLKPGGLHPTARLEMLSKSCSDSKPKSGNRKESIWNNVSKMRKQLRNMPSAGRNRAESNTASRGDSKNIGTTPSPPGKSRTRKVSKN